MVDLRIFDPHYPSRLKPLWLLYLEKIRSKFWWNRFISRFVRWQTEKLPLPLSVFRFLFSSSILYWSFFDYGNVVFYRNYKKRKNDLDYWLSKESLYWHFFRSSRIDTIENELILRRTLGIPKVSRIPTEGRRVVELGFGIGKNWKNHLRSIPFCRYYGVEINSECVSFSQIYSSDSRLSVCELSIENFISDFKEPFDTVFVFGGVLFYLPPQIVVNLFKKFIKNRVNLILIVREGTSAGPVVREDGTIMHNLRALLIEAGFCGDIIETPGERDILESFVAISSS